MSMSLSVKNAALAAGVPYEIRGGRFFRLFYASQPVTLQFLVRGSVVGEADGVQGNLGVEIECDRVLITSAAAQTVLVGISDARIDYDARQTVI